MRAWLLIPVLSLSLSACGDDKASSPAPATPTVTPTQPTAAAAAEKVPAAEAEQAPREWTLIRNRSSLRFVSIKNGDTAESHYFDEIRGQLLPEKGLSIHIPLAKTQTGIPIRNERMNEHLWQVTQFPEAVVTLPYASAAEIEKVKVGEPIKLDLPLTLELHGQKKEYTAIFIVLKVNPDRFIIQGLQPILVNAADFGLTEGINKLRELAGLESIATVVPVEFDLTFEATEVHLQKLRDWQQQLDQAKQAQSAKEAQPVAKPAP